MKTELKEKFALYHFFHQEPHIKSPGNEPEPPQSADRANCLSYETVYTALIAKEREKKREREKATLFIYLNSSYYLL